MIMKTYFWSMTVQEISRPGIRMAPALMNLYHFSKAQPIIIIMPMAWAAL